MQGVWELELNTYLRETSGEDSEFKASKAPGMSGSQCKTMPQEVFLQDLQTQLGGKLISSGAHLSQAWLVL